MDALTAVEREGARATLAPQLSCTVQDERLGTLGYVVIDRFVGATAIGGIRHAPGLTLAEVSALARAMTLKCSFLRLHMGGAKAGLIAPDAGESKQERTKRLAAFGRGIAPLIRHGSYSPGEDLGISTTDLNVIRQAAGLASVAPTCDGGYFTARTAFVTLQAALQQQKRPLAGSTVAIEGYGRVGSALATLLAQAGARIVALSTKAGAIYNPAGLDLDRLSALRQTAGDECVLAYREAEQLTLAELLLLAVDIVVPCARPWSIHAANAAAIQAAIVLPAGNIALTPAAQQRLHERGIRCLPDFVASSGAVLAGVLHSRGFQPDEITRIIDQDFRRRVETLLDQAGNEARSPVEVAQTIAWRNFRTVQQEERDQQAGMLAKLRHTSPRRLVERVAAQLYRRPLFHVMPLQRVALARTRRELGV
ncbi:MAG TPA: Glu/Leu/Phe/Val dehydrogenase dimerization domain-containing protein [Caldilineaceae bacterium]|nr:Glu/Leu/Phe/Val dehydrogenase dimerization domain-containing protein [Caldilineaceae bacterium]